VSRMTFTSFIFHKNHKTAKNSSTIEITEKH
jgi:hypothetical protein